MSSLAMQFSKATEPHNPNQFVSDMKLYFKKAPQKATQISFDETPDFEYQGKSCHLDSIVARGIDHNLVSPRPSQKWKSYPFKIMYLVASFLYKAKTSTDSYRFKLVDQRIFKLINDLSSDFNYYRSRRMLKSSIDRLQIVFEDFLPDYQLKVFQPDDLIKVIFDAMLAMMTALMLLYIPIKISFHESNLWQNRFFDVIPVITIIVEIIIKLNSAFYKDGVIIQSRKQIILSYFKNELLWDICYIFLFLMSMSGLKYLQLIILLRIKRFKQYIERIEDITFIRERYAACIDLIKLIFFLFYINHNFACIWNFIGELQLGDQTQNWIHQYNVIHVDFYQRYTISFYWCIITTSTIGYGDIVPTNYLERIICCLIIISGQIAFGYVLSSIGEIFKQIEEKTNTFKTQMSKVTYYLKQKQFDKQLQMKIIRQFEYLYSQKYKSDHNEIENLITQLIPEMAAEVKIATYLPILLKNRIFRTKFSQEFLNDLSQIMVTKSYNNGQVIIETDQPVQSLIFVAEGSLAAIANQHYLRSYQSGFVVGLKNFIIQQPVPCSFKAETSCTLYLLPYEGFIEILRKHQEDWEKFQMFKEDLIFKQQQKQIGEVCKVCKSNHQFLNCPFPFFQFNRNRLMRSQLKEQKRVFKYRRNNKMMGFRQAMQDYQLCAITAQINLNNLKPEDIDASYEAKLGLTMQKTMKSSVNQCLNLDHNSSLKFVTSKPKINSQVFVSELNQKDSQLQSNLQALPLYKQTSIKRTSLIHQNYHSFQQQRIEQQQSSKESVSETKFSQMEQIQLQGCVYLQKTTINIDKYADFRYYKQGYNIQDILNELNEIKSKYNIRPTLSTRYLKIKRSIQPTHKAKHDNQTTLSPISAK